MKHDVSAPEGGNQGIPVQDVALDPFDAGFLEESPPLVEDAADGALAVPISQGARQYASDVARRARDNVHRTSAWDCASAKRSVGHFVGPLIPFAEHRHRLIAKQAAHRDAPLVRG